MDQMDVAGGRAYEEQEEEEELDPAVEWRQAGDEQDVVEIRLPGFRKEHVRVQVDNYGVLRVTGGRPAARGGSRRWVRFTKDLRLPDGCDPDGVKARFEDDRLLITLPIVAAAAGDAASPTTPSPEPLPRTSSFQPPSSVPLPPPQRLQRRHPEHAAAPAPEPTNSAATATSAERKPWAPPAIVPGPKTTEPESRPTPPSFPPRKQSTAATVPEPKSPALSDIPIAMFSPSPPRKEMKKKEEKKMEGRKAREAASGGSGTPPAMNERREVTPKLLPPASHDPATTTDLVRNMAAAVAVLVGIALSVWRTMSGSS